MKLTEFSLRNPLYVGLIAIALAIVGVYAYLTLSISIVPNITQASAIVSTTDPGADPATIETQPGVAATKHKDALRAANAAAPG